LKVYWIWYCYYYYFAITEIVTILLTFKYIVVLIGWYFGNFVVWNSCCLFNIIEVFIVLMPTSQYLHNFDAASDLIWHKQIFLKVFIFVWRLLQNRLSSKDNLMAHEIIHSDTQACVSGCGGIETTQHMFLSCTIFCIPLEFSAVVDWSLFYWTVPYSRSLFSFFIPQVGCELVDLLCNLSGFLAHEFCGMREIIDYSRTRKTLFIGC